jgi:hypothetical protein
MRTPCAKSCHIRCLECGQIYVSSDSFKPLPKEEVVARILADQDTLSVQRCLICAHAHDPAGKGLSGYQPRRN